MRVKLNKIKLFTDNDITNLEKKINSWFKKNKYIEVIQILQSEYATNDSSDSRNGNFSRTITVCYKEIEEPSSVIPEPVAQKKLSQKNGEFEFLHKQLQEINVKASQ